MSEKPREIIARVHAERATRWRELGSGDIAGTIITELTSCGFVIVPHKPTPEMGKVGDVAVRGCYSLEPGEGFDEPPGPAAYQAMIDEALK